MVGEGYGQGRAMIGEDHDSRGAMVGEAKIGEGHGFIMASP